MAMFTITVPDTIGFKRQGEVISADVSRLNDTIAGHLFVHGLVQKVGDSAAGKTGDEARKAMAATFDQLVEGEWTQRTASTVDPITRFIRDVVRSLLAHPTNATRKAEYKALKDQEDAQAARDKYLDDWYASMPEGQADKIDALAAQKLALDQQMRESVAALRDDLVAESAAETRPDVDELMSADEVETPAKRATKKKKAA